jgi:two-component system KDP operon response regulator KdpE
MNEKTRILIIDDDLRLAEAVQIYLTKAGYEIIVAHNGREGMQHVYQQHPDLVVLDIMMPELDGWEVCARIREVANIPIVMLTARGQESDKVRGLKMGADDYLIKPFSLRELEARIGAVLRRTRLPAPVQGRELYADQELVIDSERLEVFVRGQLLALTATERRLLFLLAENAGRILPTARILEIIWGPEFIGQTEYIKLYIWRLRQKIEPQPDQPKYILTERGIGYRFAKQP